MSNLTGVEDLAAGQADGWNTEAAKANGDSYPLPALSERSEAWKTGFKLGRRNYKLGE